MLPTEKHKLLVTGATGFIGSYLCKYASRKGWPVRRLLRQTSNQVEGIVVGDLAAEPDLSLAMKNIDVVIHTAARAHIMNDTADDPMAAFRSVNVKGTLNIARQAAQASVKRFVFISSIKVNGESTKCNCPFKETDSPAPVDPYGYSKFEAEKQLWRIGADTGMEVVIIRPPLVYGPGVKANFFNLMRLVSKGIPLPFGAIHNKRSLVSLHNLTTLILLCAEHPKAANQVFLAGDGEDLSTTELMRKLGESLSVHSRLIPVPEMVLKYILKLIGKADVSQRLFSCLQVDTRKARETLGWDNPMGVNEGLKMTADWYLKR